MNKMSTVIATHDGLFHVDDLFACAVLGLVLDRASEPYEIVRTRDISLIEKSMYVVDVGEIYDAAKKRFDHHQKEGAGIRTNGIPYASIGLVWKEYGALLCGTTEIADLIDEKLIQALDADDNGVKIYSLLRDDVEVATFHSFLYAFRPTWKEDPNDFDTSFLALLPIVKQFITRKIKHVTDKLEAQSMVAKAYEGARDKRIVVMDTAYPADDFLIAQSEPLYKVSPNAVGTAWGVKAIPSAKDDFKNRKNLPESWGGLRDTELQALTGVPDAIFCHKALFLATAASKEGAIALATIAVTA